MQYCCNTVKQHSTTLSGAVDVPSVIYVEDVDDPGVVVNRVTHPVFAAPGSPLPLERLAQGADPVRVFGEGARDELEACPCDGLVQPLVKLACPRLGRS
jgi:hypothetical protein